MAFWRDGSVEPKRKYRFRVQLFEEVAWYTKSITAPSFEISTVEHHFSDHVFNYPGKIKWNEISITLVDPAGDDDVVNKTLSLLSAAGYRIPIDGNTVGDYDTFSKVELINNPTGQVILEQWELHNAILTSVKFGDFDYSSEDMREIEIGFKYDWASCTINGATNYFKDGQ